MDQVAMEHQEKIDEDTHGFPAPSASALSAYRAGGQFQSDSYAAMFNAYLKEQKEKAQQLQLTQKLEHLKLTSNEGNNWRARPKSQVYAQKMTAKDAGKITSGSKARHSPYGAKKANDSRVSKLKFKTLASQSGDANYQASMDSGNDSDTQLDMEDSEENGFGSNSLA